MEKFFIHILDVIKSLEVKAQEKSHRKKYWVLGNQYLQPVDDVDEEEKCSDYDFKKRAKCVYQAARCGMKEGMLAGVFLGGFYGLIKKLNENVSNALMPSSLVNVNSPREEKEENETEKNSSVNEEDNLNIVQSSNSNYEPETNFEEPTVVRDTTLKGKKRDKSAFTKRGPPDRGQNNEPEIERRSSSAGQNANENLFSVENVRSNTVMNIEDNKSKSRQREKVEIVGYTFIQTLGTMESESSCCIASDDSDERKEDSQKERDKSELRNRSEPESRVNSDQDGRSSGYSYPKNVLGSIKEIHKKKKLHKKEEDRRKIEHKKSSSSSSQESYPVQVLSETESKPNAENGKNEKKDVLKVIKDEKSSDQSTTGESKQKTVSDERKIGFNKGTKKKNSKGSRISIETIDSKESKLDVKRSKSKNCFSKLEKGSALNQQKKSEASNRKQSSGLYDNIFISRKISKSILVDADAISNGYSLSSNNELLNSDEHFDPLSDSNLNVLDATGQRLSRVIEHSKSTIKTDENLSYAARKKLAFVEPQVFPVPEKPSLRFESSMPHIMEIQEDNNNNESAESIGSDSKLKRADHNVKTEDLSKPLSVHSNPSLKTISGDNHPVLSQTVKSSNPRVGIVGSAPVLSGYTSPKAISMGNTAAASFVKNDGFSEKQSKELSHDKISDTGAVGSQFMINRVINGEKCDFPCPPKCDYFLLKNFSDSLILLSACNCAVVLGVLCAVVSTTKASLSI